MIPDRRPDLTPNDIVERIMSAHWDMSACPCWVCRAGRANGCRPRESLLNHVSDNRMRLPVPTDGWESP